MTVSDQLLKVLLSSLAIILLCLPVAAQPAVSTPTASPVASPASSLGVGKPAGGKAAHAEVVIPPEKAQPVRIPRFEKPPVIDGKLDDEVWKTAAVFKDFYQTNPGDNIAPSKPTEAFIGYDSKFLYFAFHAYDDPSKVRATIAKRDQVFGEDNVRVYLDTFNDQRRAYILGWNPLGIQQDGIFTEGQGADFSVDIVMESKGIITDDGWTVEVAIPFKSLRYEAGKGKLWGIHLDRNIDRFNDELDSWMPISRDISGLLSQEGHITGLEGISTERTLELIPSLTLSETGKRKGTLTAAQVNSGLLDPGRLVNDPLKFDPGLTGKYTITPTVTLDFAINPDFAQVEADQLVVTANQRFPIFFEEKRPFFLEGIDIFRTPIAAVHTRAIIDPDVAVKLTGKLSRNTFGLLLASDKGPGNFSAEDRLTANPRFIDKNAAVGVLRLKHDVGTKDSFVGLLGTHYRFVDRSNELGGFDGRFRIDKVTTFTWQVLGTHTRRLFFFPEPGQSLDRKENALIYTTDLNNNGRHFGYEWTTVGRTRYYRADVGFNRRTNTNNQNLFIRYNSEPKPKARLISWRIFTIPQINFDWQGRSQNLNDNTQLSFNFQHSTFLGVGLVGGYERIFEEEFGRKRTVARPCIVSDPCTFAGNDDERSAYDKGFYVYGGSTPSKNGGAFTYDDFSSQRNKSPSGTLSPRQRSSPSNTLPYSALNIVESTAPAIAAVISSALGQISRRYTALPLASRASGSTLGSMSIVPASA